MAGSIFVVLGVVAACGKSSDDDSTPATGGSSGKGGSSATGGTKSSGGTGGSTGGTKSTGGSTSTGGSSETGGGAGEATGGTGGTGAQGGTGGTTSTSGTGGTGDPVAIDSMCASFTACGGDVVGTWKPTKLCSNATDMGGAGGAAGLPECASNTQMNMASSDALYTFKSDGTYSVTGSLTVAVSFTVDDACAMDQGAPDAATFCELASLFGGSASGLDVTCKMSGGVCGCVFGSTQDQGSTGTYTIDGDSITIEQKTGTTSQAEGTHDFCVKSDSLTLSNTAGEQFVLTRQ